MLLLVTACAPDPPKPVDEPPLDETVCDEAAERLGMRACVPRIPDDDTFTAVTVPSVTVDQLRVGKYLVPARADARLPTVFLDVNAFGLHYDFLLAAFPDLYAGLTTDEYQRLVLYPDTREMYGGTYALYITSDGFYYGFTVWDDPADASSTVTEADVTAAWEGLRDRFEIGELAWVPNSDAQRQAALGWGDTPFAVHNPADVPYEVYNPGEAYGFLRLYTLDEFTAATEASTYGYQDILVIEDAPEDLERVVSGIVTGTRQGTLSHLNVRSAGRGTPNCYMKAPGAALAAWEDQLVRFECGATDYAVEAATSEQADAWWESIRPDPVAICAPILTDASLPGLLDLATDTAEQRATNRCTWGAKGSNLGALYQRIPDAYQLDGFVISFAYYQSFLDTHGFSATLAAWHADPDFLTDPAIRRARLTELRAAIEAAPVDPEVIAALAERIRAVFGSDTVGVRFRSSGNAEDGLYFNGAGLYESRTACVADEYDGDDAGPSRCDADTEEERTLTDALQDVWGSPWKMSAWDERDWYGIDHTMVAMGVLCDTRSNDELANIVAFTGNPSSDTDDRYLVNAQYGELEVVSAEAGVYPETSLLTVSDGVVTGIDRVSASSEIDEVLSDARLAEMGSLLFEITEVYPLDAEIPAGHDVLWDTEWKVTAGGQLVIKQIRPFLR